MPPHSYTCLAEVVQVEALRNTDKRLKQNKSVTPGFLIAALLWPEIIEKSVDEIKTLNLPFGYKANLWKTEEPVPVHKFASPVDKIAVNPIETMGTRGKDYNGEKFLEFSKKMKSKGATILGGCCETKPFHIEKISSLKN